MTKPIRTSPTTYAVPAESLTCNRPGCDYQTNAQTVAVGDPCPRCHRGAHLGTLERHTYEVDLEHRRPVGGCGCQHYTMVLETKLRQISKSQVMAEPGKWRCKHIDAARKAAKEDENFDALLMALPNQGSQI